MPNAEVDLGDFELLAHEYAPIIEDDQGRVVAAAVYTLTAFSTGELEIPSLTISYRIAGENDEGSITTDPIGITVESVLTAEAEDIRDIKPPLEVPRDWLPLALAFVAGAVLMVLALILWRRRKRATEEMSSTSDPDVPPHIEAFRALNRVSQAGLLDRGEVMRFHVEVSEIIRRYFSGRFKIDALEMTSQELLLSLPGDVSLPGSQRLLGQCDLVKFAKFEPTRAQSEALLETAYEIVETTKPRFDSRTNGTKNGMGSPVLTEGG